MAYLAIGPSQHVIERQVRAVDAGRVPPERDAEEEDNDPEGEDDV